MERLYTEREHRKMSPWVRFQLTENFDVDSHLGGPGRNVEQRKREERSKIF